MGENGSARYATDEQLWNENKQLQVAQAEATRRLDQLANENEQLRASEAEVTEQLDLLLRDSTASEGAQDQVHQMMQKLAASSKKAKAQAAAMAELKGPAEAMQAELATQHDSHAHLQHSAAEQARKLEALG